MRAVAQGSRTERGAGNFSQQPRKRQIQRTCSGMRTSTPLKRTLLCAGHSWWPLVWEKRRRCTALVLFRLANGKVHRER